MEGVGVAAALDALAEGHLAKDAESEDGGGNTQAASSSAEAEPCVSRDQKLLGAWVKNVGAVLDMPLEDHLQIEMSFKAEDGTYARRHSALPTNFVEGHCHLAAAELATEIGRPLALLELELLGLEFQDLWAARDWASTFSGQFKGGHRAMLDGTAQLPPDVDFVDILKQMGEARAKTRDADWRLGNSFADALLAVAAQRIQLEMQGAQVAARRRAIACHLPLKDVQFAESRAAWWVDAADGLLQMLEQKGVQQGQVLAIDAHTSNPEEEAAFSAHYSLELPGSGDLGIRYKRCEEYGEDFRWEGLYDWANCQASQRQIISMTASRGRSGGGVFTSFYYRGPCQLEGVEVLEQRSSSWTAAADELAIALRTAGVQAGQVLWVDAHLAPETNELAFAAHFSRSLPARGELCLKYTSSEGSEGQQSFKELNAWAASRLEQLGIRREELVSVTFSSSHEGAPACYVFYTGPPGSTTPASALSDQPRPNSADGAAAEPPQEAAEATGADGFQVLPRKVVFLGKHAHAMPADDIEACKGLCRQRGFGAFTVSSKMAYFRREGAQKCQANLADDPRSTTYILRNPSSQPAGKPQDAKDGTSRTPGQVEQTLDGMRHESCQCAAQ